LSQAALDTEGQAAASRPACIIKTPPASPSVVKWQSGGWQCRITELPGAANMDELMSCSQIKASHPTIQAAEHAVLAAK
jgi:hypothetical protein